MTDADRLREAADALPLRHTIDCKMVPGSMWHPCTCGAREQRDKQADLLRAVADEGEVCWCGPEYTERGLSRPGCPAHDVMLASVDAALAFLGTES